ncbi:MAG: hypothetical protein CM1200mP27_13100 [Chloroflexota bacterium]|nr:MAG: hypothetical protein CM1200mP27_13100 [Chloroflexota bacterium]
MALPAGHIVRTKLVQDVQQVILLRIPTGRKACVGIPYMVNGKAGDSAKLARGFIRALRKETGLASMKWTNVYER